MQVAVTKLIGKRLPRSTNQFHPSSATRSCCRPGEIGRSLRVEGVPDGLPALQLPGVAVQLGSQRGAWAEAMLRGGEASKRTEKKIKLFYKTISRKKGQVGK